MNRTATLLLLTATLLASCTPPSTPDGGNGGGGTPPPVTRPAGWTPEPGAAPETGPGTTKVRVTPTVDDIAVITYTNEFRTKGTVRGIDPTYDAVQGGQADTRRCLADSNFKPGTLAPLTFDGIAHVAALNHAKYLQINGYLKWGHDEGTGFPGFTGETSRDRYFAALAVYGTTVNTGSTGENILMGIHDNNVLDADQRAPFVDSAAYAVLAWAGSYGHCMNMLDPEYNRMGATYLNAWRDDPVGDPYGQKYDSNQIIGVQVFRK